MCSMLLQRNTDTRKRKLNIRRYKVTHVIYLFTCVLFLVFKASLFNSKRIINQEWVVLLHISSDLCAIDL